MISPHYTVDYFEVEDEVIYLPNHAINDFAEWLQTGANWLELFHKFEMGIVSSKNDRNIFVRYYFLQTRDGDKMVLQENGKATSPTDLILWRKRKI